MTKALAKMNLNGEFYFGKDLSIESNFLEEAEKILKREFSMDVGFYYGKKVMNFFVELNKIDLEISKKLMFKILIQIWMCILFKKRLCVKLVGVRVICLKKERLQVNATWLNFLG